MSRFDVIFLVRDVRDEELDKMICHHVMGVHINNSRGGMSASTSQGPIGFGLNSSSTDGGLMEEQAREQTMNANASPEAIADNAMQVATTGIGELDVPTMKKYIQYCKSKCSPRLSEEAGEILASSYVKIRDDVRKRAMEHAANNRNEEEDGEQAVIPITVRQLEALIRLSESLSKMRLEDEVQGQDIAEALRLFKVSTMAANSAGSTGDGGAGGGSTGREGKNDLVGNGTGRMRTVMPSREEMVRTETFLRSRLAIGTTVNKQRIIEEAASQGYDATVVTRDRKSVV